MQRKLSFGLLSLLLSLSTVAKQYLPIVLVHGVLSDAYYMKPVEKHIRTYLGDESVVHIQNINIGDGQLTSLANIFDQVKILYQAIEADPELQNGFNMIAHSQGGLVARYYIERYNNPKVINYISWGAPQQGVFGIPGTIDDRFTWLNYMEGYAHNVLYSWAFQKYVSFAGYWHDTLHYDTYINHCRFLPYLNNEIDHEHAPLFKENICSLKNMVVVMSTIDDVVEPSESCHFGFYKKGSKTELITMFESDIYTHDTLGLKTLYQSGRLHLRFADCEHIGFQKDEKNFVNNGLEFLKASA